MASLLMTLAILTLATGQFPPPFAQIWQNIRGMQELISPHQLAEAQRDQQQREALIRSLEGSGETKDPEMMQKKIKALEFEVLSLRSKLDNCTATIPQSH